MALVNPNIAMSYKPTTEYQPRNALAEYAQVQQIMGGQTQQEVARMQLDKMKRDEQALGTMMQSITAKGGPSDPVEAATAMIKSGIPHFMDVGLKMQQAVRDNQDARAAMGLPPLPTYGAAPAAAPTPMAPAQSTVPYPQTAPATGLGTGTFGISAPTNALAPAPAAPAAPVNALAAPAAGGMSMEEQRARTMLLSPNAGVREAGKAELARLTAVQTVAPGSSIVSGGKVMYTAPAARTNLAKLQTEMAALPAGDPRRAQYEALIRKETTHAPSAQQTVLTYTPASVEAQKQFVQTATEERKALRNAPDTLKNIDAAKKLIPSASTFMGTGGEPLLAATSFLNNRLGLGISTKGVTDATVLRTRLFEGILDNLKKLDSQPSQEQQRVLAEALGNLGTDPAALSQILDRIGETVRDRVDRFNTDVTEAETRGVKFPFKPQVALPVRAPAVNAAAQIPGQAPVPSMVRKPIPAVTNPQFPGFSIPGKS